MTDDISKALRIAADHIQDWQTAHLYRDCALVLRQEADRLDRAAADDAEIEEAAKVHYSKLARSADWQFLHGDTKRQYIEAAKTLRDHFRKPERDDAGLVKIAVASHLRKVAERMEMMQHHDPYDAVRHIRREADAIEREA